MWTRYLIICKEKIKKNTKPFDDPISYSHLGTPANCGPVTEQLNKVAGKLADFMRNSLEDLFKEMAVHGSPEATIKALQVS